jgi:hypothetical protein
MRNQCNCRRQATICPAWKRIRRDSVMQMYLEGARMSAICKHWNLGHNTSVTNLIGKQNLRHAPGLRRGIQAIDANGAVAWSFFPIKSCVEHGFAVSSVMNALKTGKPHKGFTWRYCT